jgi:hypothetical protein
MPEAAVILHDVGVGDTHGESPNLRSVELLYPYHYASLHLQTEVTFFTTFIPCI